MKATGLLPQKDPVLGATLRDEGIQRAINSAIRDQWDWKDLAIEFVRFYPREEFSSHDVRVWAYAKGLERPPEERAWGAVMRQAANDGMIIHLGWRQTDNPKAHRSPLGWWRKSVKTQVMK